MNKRKKLWTSMQIAALAGLVTLEGCGTEGEGEAEGAEAGEAVVSASAALGSEGEGENDGEGEGSESGIDLAHDDLAYLTQLSLMRGHLSVGNALFQAGHIEHAQTHMKHPKSELYADVVPAFEARGADGFASELETLALAVEQGEAAERVAEHYDALRAAIAKSASFVSEASASVKERLRLVVALLRVAAEEYAIAVVDGKVNNAHEYQDALGFSTIAAEMVDGSQSSNETEAAALASAKQILVDLSPMWPTLIPPETLDTEAGQLYGAASKIEILALGL